MSVLVLRGEFTGMMNGLRPHSLFVNNSIFTYMLAEELLSCQLIFSTESDMDSLSFLHSGIRVENLDSQSFSVPRTFYRFTVSSDKNWS